MESLRSLTVRLSRRQENAVFLSCERYWIGPYLSGRKFANSMNRPGAVHY